MDIPVGDYRKSTLHLYPSLCLNFAPIVYYTQTEGMDLCVSKSFASALHNIGLEKEAKELDTYAEHMQVGGKADTLKMVHKHIARLIPKWLQPKKMTTQNFDWKTKIDTSVIVLGVLRASDGNCSHAVTIHGRFIYDANERVAIPLTKEGLDYCTSDGDRKSEFCGFVRGYIYTYQGIPAMMSYRMTPRMYKINMTAETAT